MNTLFIYIKTWVFKNICVHNFNFLNLCYCNNIKVYTFSNNIYTFFYLANYLTTKSVAGESVLNLNFTLFIYNIYAMINLLDYSIRGNLIQTLTGNYKLNSK